MIKNTAVNCHGKKSIPYSGWTAENKAVNPVETYRDFPQNQKQDKDKNLDKMDDDSFSAKAF